MDIFAHILWTNLVYRKKYLVEAKNRLWAVFFGVAPDLVSFIPATIYAFFHFGSGSQMIALANSNIWVFTWARESYNYTHSLVTFAVAFLLMLAINKGKIWWPIFGWALHICIDIFTHHNFYETPFLYPLSNFKNHYGISWAEPHFMIVNYSLLVASYILIFILWRRRKNNPNAGNQ